MQIIESRRQYNADRRVAEESIVTASRARIGLSVPQEQRLYAAAPATAELAARILFYRVRSSC